MGKMDLAIIRELEYNIKKKVRNGGRYELHDGKRGG